MNRLLPAALLCLATTACQTKPVATTEVRRADTHAIAYQDFVARRTQELQRMGGPLADRSVAEGKAIEEARARYGDVPPEVSTTWTWGAGAGRKQAQAEVNATLEKMDRDAASR